jgi:hypothetical protein
LRKQTIKAVLLLLIIYIIFSSNFFIRDSYAAVEDFEPEFGYAPNINGDIDHSENEWENASKEEIRLKNFNSTSDPGILIDIWVLQNGSDLYILVQFELLSHSSEEFIGVIISESDSETATSFTDAKIIQCSNLGTNEEDFEFSDYYIVGEQFFKDSDENGDGAMELDDDTITYEFRIPVNESEGDDDRDVSLEFGEIYAFKIIYGEDTNYYNGTNLKNNIVSIEIEYPPKIEKDIWKIASLILIIITFSVIGALFGLYIYKVVNIKKKLERIRK